MIDGRLFVTDGGIETDLEHRRGAVLREFAAFPLLETASGRELLASYYADYAAIAQDTGRGLLLESPTWRANPDWGRLLGYSQADLARLNGAAVEFLAEMRRDVAGTVGEVLIGGSIGPRHDGYAPETVMAADVAEEYHRPQLAAFAAAGADLATAYTLTYVGEAVGIVRAARDVRLPIAISFTVETDGRLASGVTLEDAIREVDTLAAPDHYLVNCAHASHVEAALREPGEWTRRIAGTRANAATAGHDELDAAVARGDGDPAEFAAAQRRLSALLPAATIVGGCCGTDARHVAAAVRAITEERPA